MTDTQPRQCRAKDCDQPENPAMRTPRQVATGEPGWCDQHAAATIMRNPPGWNAS